MTFGSLEVVLDRGQIEDWFHSTYIITFATIALCSFMFFIPWELTHSDPIVDIRLLCRRQFGMAFLVMMAVGAILFGSNQITPQLMQTNFPYTAMLSGFAVMPGGLAMLIMMPIAGQVTGLMQPKYWMAIGLATIALAMWYSTSLTPDASFGYFVTIRIFQTIGLPFLFIPINSVSYDGLPQQKTSEGSALMNVARNLGGSFGVSLANTELLQRSQFHQARLVENVVPSSPVYQSIVKQITEFFAHTGSPANAAGRAMGYIGHMIESQAAILAYIDIFYSWAIFAACLIPVVLLLIRRVRRGAAEATATH
jgi:DHA2 family multidrug resistance protein